ncbi:isoprenyl transferase [Algoriphagus aestuariicola]|jgi:undecaprenyl diphosphate synthase|uniref:Isoprenyl transferase n=1 Tax=Algoriphagus aestuariicola TaxID=1852016 RepID=A0ABS3BTS1_9BACT|nr:isoprenyl transferase [Algoriphagus aestuariicola]MBN7802689.1 isoprenyl transferase [Algoriphagus aestuariicola]
MKEKLDLTKIPRHIAIIMDGNGRWAKKKGAMRIFGHRHAIQAVKDAIEGADDLGVKYLTLFSFSTENWSRPQDEVKALMELLVKTIIDEISLMMKNNIRLISIGDTESLPRSANEKLEEARKQTENNTGLTVVLALSYSGQWELTKATKRIAQKISEGKLKPEEITQQTIADHLDTAGIPDPELMIRTSGEHRISNFLLWQLAYTELYFTPVLWPDFRMEHLHAAIEDYQKRERRFGKTGEQVKS